jgi:hypothetical protein
VYINTEHETDHSYLLDHRDRIFGREFGTDVCPCVSAKLCYKDMGGTPTSHCLLLSSCKSIYWESRNKSSASCLRIVTLVLNAD